MGSLWTEKITTLPSGRGRRCFEQRDWRSDELVPSWIIRTFLFRDAPTINAIPTPQQASAANFPNRGQSVKLDINTEATRHPEKKHEDHSLPNTKWFIWKHYPPDGQGSICDWLTLVERSPVNLPECVLISVTILAKISMTFTKCHGHFWRNKIILISVINTGIFKNFESKISGILFHQKFWQKSSRHYGS